VKENVLEQVADFSSVAKELWVAETVLETFPDPLPEKHLHIIVTKPTGE
jgi:hypothetical protein